MCLGVWDVGGHFTLLFLRLVSALSCLQATETHMNSWEGCTLTHAVPDLFMVVVGRLD